MTTMETRTIQSLNLGKDVVNDLKVIAVGDR
jgi:hypothetical protein